MKTIFFILLFILILIPFCSAAHFIVGVVNNAKSGVSANDREIVLWNPANGINDNLTDIIGVNGNSGAANIFMIDCELLSNGCSIGDEMMARIFNLGDFYATTPKSVIVTGAGYDMVDEMRLNTPPNSTTSIYNNFRYPDLEFLVELDLILWKI